MVRWVLLAALALAGCVDKEKFKVDEAYVAENTLAVAPTPQIAVGADLGGKVIYLGADIDKLSLAPGDRFRIVHYWKVVEPPGPEWRVFTHVISPEKGDWINIDDSKLRRHHPVSAWKAGEILRDEQVIPIRDGWKANQAFVVVGLFPKGGRGAGDRMPVSAAHDDGERRVRVTTLAILAPGARPVPPPYLVRRASGPIKLDGRADEADWASAAGTGEFKIAEGSDVVPPTRARLLWDDTHLYVFIEADDTDLVTQFTRHDEPIWKEDCVELFIDADGSGRGYVELQASPRGVTFDSWFPTVRPHGDVPWESGMKAGIDARGTVADSSDEDRGWSAELAIPLAAVKGRDDEMKVAIPPAVGDRWRLNIVRVDKNRNRQIAASAWAQIGFQDFHAIDRLLPVTFADAAGRVQGRDAGAR